MRQRLHAMRDAVQTQNEQVDSIKRRLNTQELRYRLRLAEVRRPSDETESEWVLTGRGVGGQQQTTTRVVDGLPEHRILGTVGDRVDVAKGGM
jgi:hypothetical protein